MKTSETLYLTT